MTTTSLALIAVDIIAALVLTLGIYYPRHRRRDLVVAFLGVNIGVLAVASVLGTAEVALGLGLGLFGVLSIIRLRSSGISQRDVAYYFAALAMGLISGLPTSDVVMPALLIVLILVVMWVADHPALLGRSRHQTIRLDRAIADETELRSELERRLSATVTGVTVQHLDLVNDSTLVDVRYRVAASPRAGSEGATTAALPTVAPAGKVLAVQGHDASVLADMRPSLLSDYWRSTLLLDDGSRATFGTRVRWWDAAVADSGVDAFDAVDAFELRDFVIIESKSAGAPGALDRWLWRAGHRPTGVSKFGTGTAVLHPELPQNRWARQLRGSIRRCGTTTSPRRDPAATPYRDFATGRLRHTHLTTVPRTGDLS